jgi:hypothetical protein
MSIWLKSTRNLFLISISILTFVGCSLRSTALKYSDSLIMYQLDQMFDLSDKQEEYLEPRVKGWIEWLKMIKKEDLIKVLSYAQSSWGNGLDKSEYEKIRAGFRSFFTDFSAKINPEITQFLKGLSDKQLLHFSEYLAESNEDYEELADSKEFEQDRRDQLRDRLENFYGEVTEAQIAKVVSYTRGQDEVVAYLKQREISQAYSLDLLKKGRSDPKIISELVGHMFTAPEELRPKKYRKEYRSLGKSWNSLWVNTDLVMTSEQRKHAQKVISDFISDLKEWN